MTLVPHAQVQVYGGEPLSGSSALWLILGLGLGIPLLVSTILFFVFSRMAQLAQRQRAALEGEGIMNDGGLTWMTIRYRGFRAPGVAIGAGIRKMRVQMVLTQRQLAFLPLSRHYMSIARSELGRFSATAEDGALHLRSDDPPNASGTIDMTIPVPEAAGWAQKLREAGARGA